MKRIGALLLVISFILSLSSLAQATSITTNISSFMGRKFSVENEGIESYESSEIACAENLSLVINGNSADLLLVIENHQLNFELLLLPSQFAVYKGNTIIGLSIEGCLNYNVASFRVEKNAFQIGLMEENYSLVDKTVLYLGIENLLTNEIYYFQLELPCFDFAPVFQVVNTYYDSTKYSPDEVERIEASYLTLSSTKSQKNTSPTTISIEGSLSEESGNVEYSSGNHALSETLRNIKEISKNGFVKMNNTNSRSLINVIPDEVYKSGELYKWKKAWNGWTEKTGYAVYPMQYAGTSNRIHYIMTFYISQKLIGMINLLT